MPVDPNDPKMKGFVPLNPEWALDCPRVATRRIRDESHFQGAVPFDQALPNAVNDAAAKAIGVPVYGFYQNSGAVRQRLI